MNTIVKNAEPFDISDLDAADESEMVVNAAGRATNWVWVFAGPGHPKTIEQSNRIGRERLHLERQQEQARVNGRKWKAQEESTDESLNRNVTLVLERLLGWHLVDKDGNATDVAVTMNGEPFPFSAENAKKILTDRRKSALLFQALDFLSDEAAFTRRSANN